MAKWNPNEYSDKFRSRSFNYNLAFLVFFRVKIEEKKQTEIRQLSIANEMVDLWSVAGFSWHFCALIIHMSRVYCVIM